MPGAPETKTALIVVRTYPTPATKGVEVSCTAAITDQGEWLRLFPVPYRRLKPVQRFHKYQWIDIEVEKSSDARPESFRISRQDMIAIKSPVLSTADGWRARKDIIAPLMSPSMCALRRQRDEHKHPTLGIFKPARIDRLIIEPAAADWTPAQLKILRQGDLFETAPAEELQKIPFDFSYEFHCSDAGCNGHTMRCTDWEMGQAWRKWQTEYGDGCQEKFRLRFEHEMQDKLDTHLYVGTVHKFPATWIVVGLFYPPKVTPKLF